MTEPKPRRCPHCGSERILAIAYSDKPGAARLQSDATVLHRTAPTGNDPRWHCARCHLEWGYPHGLSGTSPSDEELA